MKALSPRTLEDIPATPLSRTSTESIQTGSWKYVQPRFRDALPPCSDACPAGNDISSVLMLASAGSFAAAARVLRSANPFPSTLGRVCPHPCEQRCNREQFGGCVAVHMLERFVGDRPLPMERMLRCAARTGRRIAVVGAGPTGITAGYLLALRGHEVEIFDDKPRPGGYLRTGIPDYRLPKEILDREIGLVERAGVRFTQETRVGSDISVEDLGRRFDALIFAVGLHRSRILEIAGADHPRVYSGARLLERILSGERPQMPPALAVIGGGNTAVDVARSVLRLGVRPILVYRRTREEMPAIRSEVADAEREGIEIYFQAAPKRVATDGDAVVALECLKMNPGEPDSSGRRRPLPVEGSEFLLPVQGVVAAIGETAGLEFLPDDLRARVGRARDGASAGAAVFAAGDVVTGAGTVAAAVGSGRRVADAVDRHLSGVDDREVSSLQGLWLRPLESRDVVNASLLNPAYIAPQPGVQIREMPVDLRRRSFAEITDGLTEEEALLEARRCVACGTCNECMNCYYFCPDIAIHKKARDRGFYVDLDHCKGCGICVEECPRGVLELEGVAS